MWEPFGAAMARQRLRSARARSPLDPRIDKLLADLSADRRVSGKAALTAVRCVQRRPISKPTLTDRGLQTLTCAGKLQKRRAFNSAIRLFNRFLRIAADDHNIVERVRGWHPSRPREPVTRATRLRSARPRSGWPAVAWQS
jgi:hypothetical protein